MEASVFSSQVFIPRNIAFNSLPFFCLNQPPFLKPEANKYRFISLLFL